MSDIENEKNKEPGEAADTDVEAVEQPEASQPTETPAAEPENVEEGSPAEPEAAVEESPTEPEAAAEEPAREPEAESDVAVAKPQAPPAADGEADVSGTQEDEVLETGTSAEPARKRRLKHISRGERRQRTKTQREKPKTRRPIVRLEKPEHERGRRQERRGVVVSDAMDKTIVVKVESIRAHQRYKKVIRRSVKFHAHDEQNQAHVGDRVRIVETKPLSKTKRWRLAEILEAAK
jgi:small subunit ribosomal protein S17